MKKKWVNFAIILVFSIAAAGLLFMSGVIRNWDRLLYDRCINNRIARNSGTQSPFIASIDLTDASILSLGTQLDTRKAFADIIDVLYESNFSVAALDFLFPHEKSHDADFAAAMEQAGYTIITALAIEKNRMKPPYRELNEGEARLMREHIWHIKVLAEGNVPEAGSFLLPQLPLAQAAAQIAHINIEPDDDGIYRRNPLLYKWEGGYIPSLALAAAVLHLSIPPESITLKAGAYIALPLDEEETIRIPIDEQGRILVPYSQNWKDIKGRIPFHTVVEAKNNPDIFDRVFNGLNGRIAFIAEINSSQKDFGPTSFEKLYPLSGVHSEVLSSILDWQEDRAFIYRCPAWYKILMLLLIICAAFACFCFSKETHFHLGYFLALLILTGVTALRWHIASYMPWFALSAVMLFLLWAGSFFIRLLHRYREQLLLRNALSRYFPHALAERIMRERKTELIPAYKELAILFSDISGFTKWCSDKSPEMVHDFLNDYLESMAEIIFSYGGTVDKFMGDGILAFFGDPFDMPNHSEQCVYAAIAMQKKAAELAARWKPLVGIDLKVRIGINTGKVIVGNLGSKTRIEYTIIGAAVNLAQRMESNAPLGGVLVTADVQKKLKNTFTFTEKKEIMVKGYDEMIEAWVVEPVVHKAGK